MGDFDRGVRIVAMMVIVAAGAVRARAVSAGETERVSVPSPETSTALPAEADAVPPAPRLRVVWIDVLGAAPYAFQNAARETTAILGAAGIQMSWTLGEAATVSAEDESTSRTSCGRWDSRTGRAAGSPSRKKKRWPARSDAWPPTRSSTWWRPRSATAPTGSWRGSWAAPTSSATA